MQRPVGSYIAYKVIETVSARSLVPWRPGRCNKVTTEESRFTVREMSAAMILNRRCAPVAFKYLSRFLVDD